MQAVRHTIWAYVHSGDWDVWGAMTSPGLNVRDSVIVLEFRSPKFLASLGCGIGRAGTGGKWIADPPIPAGSISPC